MSFLRGSRKGVAFSNNSHCLSFKNIAMSASFPVEQDRGFKDGVHCRLLLVILATCRSHRLHRFCCGKVQPGLLAPSPRAISLEHATSVKLRRRSTAVCSSPLFSIILACSTDVTPTCVLRRRRRLARWRLLWPSRCRRSLLW